jgi:GNAT superfamily N-acetyltransferase
VPAPYWTNRLCRPEDTDALMGLVRIVHGDQYQWINRAYWHWRYLDHADFRADVFLAEFEGRPIGVLPMAVFDFVWGCHSLQGALYTGLVTHPEHRRRGIFKSLIDSCNARTAERGALFSMGMPNEAALPGYFKFGEWVHVGLIPVYVKVLSLPAVLRPKTGRLLASVLGSVPQLCLWRPRRSLGPAVEVQAEQSVPADLDAVADRFAADCGALMIRRSAAYWNWRYCFRPEVSYRTLVARQGARVVGAVVWTIEERRGLRFGVILDVVSSAGVPGCRQLLRAAERDMGGQRVGLVMCQATIPLLQQALRAEHFWYPSARWLPKKFHYIYRPSGVPGLPRSLTSIADWHLTFGDSDNI